MLGKKELDDMGTGNLNTIIGKGSSLEGKLVVQSTLRVDGKIKGTVTTSESLVVGKEGVVDGEVQVRNAIVGGKLKGKLTASGKVVLEASSQFSGELKTSKLVIDEGASFEGNCCMGAPEVKKNDLGGSVSAIFEKKDENRPAEVKDGK